MGSKNRFLVFAAIFSWILISVSRNGCLGFDVHESTTDVVVRVRGATSIAKTDEKFICATLDWWPPSKCDYGQCPWAMSSILNLVCFILPPPKLCDGSSSDH